MPPKKQKSLLQRQRISFLLSGMMAGDYHRSAILSEQRLPTPLFRSPWNSPPSYANRPRSHVGLMACLVFFKGLGFRLASPAASPCQQGDSTGGQQDQSGRLGDGVCCADVSVAVVSDEDRHAKRSTPR